MGVCMYMAFHCTVQLVIIIFEVNKTHVWFSQVRYIMLLTHFACTHDGSLWVWVWVDFPRSVPATTLLALRLTRRTVVRCLASLH